jgi:uncharacterized protein (TIGR02217 family)
MPVTPADFLLNRGHGPNLELRLDWDDIILEGLNPEPSDTYQMGAVLTDDTTRPDNGGYGPWIESTPSDLSFRCFVMSMWFRSDAEFGWPWAQFDSNSFWIYFQGDSVGVGFFNENDNTIAWGNAMLATPISNFDGWLHILVSADVQARKFQLVINDQLQVIDPVEWYPAYNETYTPEMDPDFGTFAITWFAEDRFFWDGNDYGPPSNNSIGDFFFDPTPTFVDFSEELNRRLFIDGSKLPVDLGDDGKQPFGTAPYMWYSYRPGYVLAPPPAPIPEMVFPDIVSFNASSSGGAGFKTAIMQITSGASVSAAQWQGSRGAWSIDCVNLNQMEMEALRTLFYEVRGRAYAFRFKDWNDHKLPNWLEVPGDLDPIPQLFVTDGTTPGFQLYKRYEDQGGLFQRKIIKPVLSTLRVFDGSMNPTLFIVDEKTGIVVLTPEVSGTVGQPIYGHCEFDCWVRFDTDQADIETVEPGVYSWTGIKLTEVWLG